MTYSLLACGVAAPVVFVPFVLWAAAETPGYSHISSTFSDAAAQGQPHPEIMGTGLLVLALAVALSSLGIARSAPRLRIPIGASLLLAAIAIAGTGLFRDYDRSPGAAHNLEGFVHNACASAAILSIVFATVLTGLASYQQPGWRHLFSPAWIFALGAVLAGISFQIGPDARDGLAERAFAAFSFTWLSIVATNGIWVLMGTPELRARLALANPLTRRLAAGDPPPDV